MILPILQRGALPIVRASRRSCLVMGELRDVNRCLPTSIARRKCRGEKGLGSGAASSGWSGVWSSTWHALAHPAQEWPCGGKHAVARRIAGMTEEAARTSDVLVGRNVY